MENRKDYSDYEAAQRPRDVSDLVKVLTSLGDAAVSDESKLDVGHRVRVDRREDVIDEGSDDNGSNRRWVGSATAVSATPRRIIGKGGKASVVRTPSGVTIFREEVPTLRGGRIVREVEVRPASHSDRDPVAASLIVSTARYDRRGRLLKSPVGRGVYDVMRSGRHGYLTGMDRTREYEGHIDRGLSRTANRVARRVVAKLGYTEPFRAKKPYPGLAPDNLVPKKAGRRLRGGMERRPVVKGGNKTAR